MHKNPAKKCISLASCKVPSNLEKEEYGKSCPYDTASCLNGNKIYSSLQTAWEQCEKVQACGFVMIYPNSKYYLRRLSDPNVVSEGIWGYNYTPCRKWKCFAFFLSLFHECMVLLLYKYIHLKWNYIVLLGQGIYFLCLVITGSHKNML